MIDREERQEPWVYLDGQILALGDARISPLDRGFQYGDGVFTTLRAESGRPLYLSEHLARLTRSLEDLRIPVEALHSMDWPHILGALLRRNNLAAGPAAVKICVSRGPALPLGLPPAVRPTVFIQARPYQPPGLDDYSRGWRLHVYREGCAPPLARHKSLNYLYYLVARQAAVDAGADEAVILDAGGQVAETAAGSLLARTGGRWWTPQSPYQLPGITLDQVRRLLAERGQPVDSRTAAPEDLAGAQTAWVVNSLMGIMPVRSVDGRELAIPAAEEAETLRTQLFSHGG
jgi:branched-chain amino acid aminotransferase/para-aminobenzoate synthetase component 1